MKIFMRLISKIGIIIITLFYANAHAQSLPKVAIWPLQLVNDEQIYGPISIALENTLTEFEITGRYEVYLRKNFSMIEAAWREELSKLYEGTNESEKRAKALAFLRKNLSVVDIYFFYEILEQEVDGKPEYILYVIVGKRPDPPDKVSTGKPIQLKESEVKKLETLKNKIKEKITRPLLKNLGLLPPCRYPWCYKPDRVTYFLTGLSAIAWGATLYYDKTVVASFDPINFQSYRQANNSELAELERNKIEAELEDWDDAINKRTALYWIAGGLTTATLAWHIWISKNKPDNGENESRIGGGYQQNLKLQIEPAQRSDHSIQGIQIRLSLQF